MKTFVALYKKEMKSIRSIALIIISFIIFMFVLEFLNNILPYVFQPSLKIRDMHCYISNYRYYEYRFLWASRYMLPVILLFSLIIERKTGTRYQMLSLPVHPSQVILAKFMAVVSAGIVFSFFYAFWITNTMFILCQWLYGGYTYIGNIRNKVPFDFNYLLYSWSRLSVWKSMSGSILHISLFCSLVCVAQAVMTAVKRYRISIWAVTFIGTLSLYIFIGRMIYGEFFLSRNYYIYPMCTALLILIVGLKLFDKYGEV